MGKINIIITFIAFLLLSACATYHPKYADSSTTADMTSENDLERSFYILGNPGITKDNQHSAVAAYKRYVAEHNSKKSVALLMGNAFYPSGLPKKDKPDYNTAMAKFENVRTALAEFKGQVVYVPGNLDWGSSVDGLEREEDLLEEWFEQEDVLQPNNGCPLDTRDIGDEITLITIDSQWYLEDWDKHPKMNDKCEIKTRSKFFIELEGELKKNKHKTIILAMHHPLITNGYYGGKYGATAQLLPIPVVGTLVSQLRSQGALSKQDRFNEQYDELARRLEVMIKDHKRLVVISAHDRSLQFSQKGNVKQLVSGSGGSATRADLSRHGLFSYGTAGFTALDVYKDGSVNVRFFKANEDGTSEMVYQQQIIPKEKEYIKQDFPSGYPATVKAAVYEDELVNRSGFFKTVWGDHYREVYGTEVTAKTVLLDTLYGGLKVVREGGGHQTRSLRLQDSEGKDYNMRALKKSAVQFLQTVIIKDKEIEDDFRNTIPEDLIMDFYTAAHPYGAFTIPKLSAAAGVFHTNPKLYYVPKQPALGKFNENYGDELYMIVERPDEPYDGAIFNYADDIESTDDLLDKLRTDEENVLDEEAYIRARVFDMLIGDWDRHNDQWRFAEYKDQEGKDLFVPIPRDRDQVYANFDGGLLNVVRTLFSTARQFQVYGAELEHTKWFNLAGIKLDRALIENHGRDSWLEQARILQNNITDEVIESAFNDLPAEVQDETAADIKSKLKGRRDNLVKIAGEYFDYFSRLQTVTGTDKDDYFEITRLDNGITNVKVYRIKDGAKADLIVDRNYNSSETKELWIYGLDDDDVFEVKGEGRDLIFIRIIGGQNNDIYNFSNGKKIKVYDQRSAENTMQSKAGATFRITDNYDFNTYDYLKQINSTNLLLPSFGYNPDDGFMLGLSNVFTQSGFQRNPFASQHSLSFGYYGATQSFDINYESEFANIFGKWNFLLGGYFRNANFTENFFGFGNETVNPEYENPDTFEREYNRVQLGGYGAHIGITKDSDYGSIFRMVLKFEGLEVENTPNRFIALAMPGLIEQRQYFATVEGAYGYRSLDNPANPTRGMTFDLVSGLTQNLEGAEGLFAFVDPALNFYNALSTNKKLVLRTAAQAQFRFGDEFEFYQAAQLGGDTGLRGFRDERFTGKTAAVGSADLRYSFNKFKTGITPLQLGIFAGYDIGRVWLENDTSEVWHSDYGGGFWVNAADLISGTFNFFTSSEGLRFTFGVSVSM